MPNRVTIGDILNSQYHDAPGVAKRAMTFIRRFEGERDEWQKTAEDIFRMACEVEEERDESDRVVSLLSACLLDAERELEEQAAEMVALRNRLEALAHQAGRDAMDWGVPFNEAEAACLNTTGGCRDLRRAWWRGHRERNAEIGETPLARIKPVEFVKLERLCRMLQGDIRAAQDAAADYHAAWQEAAEEAAEDRERWCHCANERDTWERECIDARCEYREALREVDDAEARCAALKEENTELRSRLEAERSLLNAAEAEWKLQKADLMQRLCAQVEASIDARSAADAAEAERDEARALARHLKKHGVHCWSYLAELHDAYPWLNG